jgi:hypothetical protein
MAPEGPDTVSNHRDNIRFSAVKRFGAKLLPPKSSSSLRVRMPETLNQTKGFIVELAIVYHRFSNSRLDVYSYALLILGTL